ncbi:MAG: protein phosphatase 2C domain-containing protein, partial [Pseudomonadota bacterium]
MNAFHFKTAARTHMGNVRQRNEDSHLARPEIGLWVVADGMGGHSRGDRASQLVTSTFAKLPEPQSAKELFRTVRDAIHDCHDELQKTAGEISGCTVVALLAYDGSFACVWAGDSRIYRYRHGQLAQLTTDHNLASDMIARGVDAEEAQNSPMANRLTRAVGIPGPLELDVDQDAIQRDDVFLLCSDGLTKHVDDPQISHTITAAEEAKGACRELIKMAN